MYGQLKQEVIIKRFVKLLRSFTVYMIEAKNINLQFTDNIEIPDLTLSMEQRKNIYLISKEAINNAIKYSECTLLQVLIRKESESWLFQ
ncbi:MAG: hypothetical protein IPL95_16705 [Saprospiraceae bacterium]|nr:hypothetical protein [Saprospiraceae bacterium]